MFCALYTYTVSTLTLPFILDSINVCAKFSNDGDDDYVDDDASYNNNNSNLLKKKTPVQQEHQQTV